jgi:pyoverdine/dityrosine biosynthesis protein Dit1
MKSNPYVYPYTPFHDLGNKQFVATFTDKKEVTTNELISLVNTYKSPSLTLAGTSIDKRLLEIFLNDEIRFGPREFIADNAESWKEKFRYFISENKPLQFTILGFPFKIPVPLKTDRTLPDIGEVLSLKRLFDITQLIQKEYAPGAVITIVTEGVFGRFNAMKKEEYDEYKDVLEEISKLFGWDKTLKFTELENMEKLDPQFTQLFERKVKELEELYAKQDAAFLEKYKGAEESLLRIVNTKDLGIEEDILMDVYNDSLPNDKITPEVEKLRQAIKENMHIMLMQYYAYLMVRDDLDFINKTVPHAITLTVSPKPNRLGLIPINTDCTRLPSHGIPVFHNKSNIFTTEYLIDIKRQNATFTPVYWTQDKENKPFYYIEL